MTRESLVALRFFFVFGFLGKQSESSRVGLGWTFFFCLNFFELVSEVKAYFEELLLICIEVGQLAGFGKVGLSKFGSNISPLH